MSHNKARPARLDTKGDAKPLTTIVAHIPAGKKNMSHNVANYELRDANPHALERVFRASPTAPPGYGPRIHIDRNVADALLSLEDKARLDTLSVFGGSTSGSSDYHMWEFGTDGVNYAKAHVLLRTAGWHTSRE